MTGALPPTEHWTALPPRRCCEVLLRIGPFVIGLSELVLTDEELAAARDGAAIVLKVHEDHPPKLGGRVLGEYSIPLKSLAELPGEQQPKRASIILGNDLHSESPSVAVSTAATVAAGAPAVMAGAPEDAGT